MIHYVAIRNDTIIAFAELDDVDLVEGAPLDNFERFCVYDSKRNRVTRECWIIFEKEKYGYIDQNGKFQRTQVSIGITLNTNPVANTKSYGDPGDWRLEEVTKAEFQNGIHLMELPVLECTSKLMYVL